jgi:hypothetical protein
MNLIQRPIKSKKRLMRYIAKYIGNSTWAVIDTLAPESVKENQPYGHVLLITHNGMQPVQIAADALNNRPEPK